eukprot:GFKZ01007962.1.p1 GENE.GFKZ01007962.1~~GFKZ01007962.1.p1  ORF type:complete len:405 (-),score=64.97 GFKZ01007962.1:346-1560(-)
MPSDERHILTRLQPSPTRAPSTLATPSSVSPQKPNLWSILKHSIGKDLARITLPVLFNEPLSFLQRLSEDVEYSHLLDDAYQASGPDRAALVAAFVISHYSATAGRASKPFNPLLGETFEMHLPNKLSLVAEQVAHHPPTSAIHVTGSHWTYHTAHEIKNKFRGNSMEVWPAGAVHICFDDGEHYVYEQARTFVHNIVIGDLWIDNVGTITIREVTNNAYVATIKLKRSSPFFGEAKHHGDVSGKVCSTAPSEKGKVLKKLAGNWNKEVTIDNRVVWKVMSRPSKEMTANHNMTSWAWALNADVDAGLPKTDSRLRPDQRAWEKGLYQLASNEKERLEDEQRVRRRDNERNGAGHSPRWFEMKLEPSTGRREWMYRFNYFQCKYDGWPDNLPDIFGLDKKPAAV